ncbi:uncharacterized protein LOC116603512 isoform X2 [Nematostella vectensis]|uniref:uncharacterized protein LOC116603512 isoform X2 n=1 Tax=Nematostella vectensis TaxID=45351 RepID=UPI0020775CBF|nr:uncharacterized protein LOC116603512 isoform X2 [Nematostella vectensis]
MNGKTAETTPPASTNEQSELMKFGSLISNSIINLQETMQDSFSKFRTTIEETWYEDGSGPQEVSRYQISESGSSGDESADENQPKTSKRPRIGASPVGQETAARVSDQPTDKSAASPSGGKTSSDNVLSAIAGRLDMKEKTEKSVNAQLAELMPSEGSRGGSTRSNTCSSLANSDILPHTSEHADRSPTGFAKEGEPADSTSLHGTASTQTKVVADGLLCLWECLQTKSIPDEAKTIILKSWRTGTKKQCATYLKKWEHFCSKRQIDRTEASVENALAFLTSLYNSGLKYSAINTARSALSCLDCGSRITIGNHPLI